MIRRPTRYTRTDTLFPYTTLFRSRLQECERFPRPRQLHLRLIDADARRAQSPGLRQGGAAARWIYNGKCRDAVIVPVVTQIARLTDRVAKPRSEERRVGKECVSTGRSRWSPYHKKKK